LGIFKKDANPSPVTLYGEELKKKGGEGAIFAKTERTILTSLGPQELLNIQEGPPRNRTELRLEDAVKQKRTPRIQAKKPYLHVIGKIKIKRKTKSAEGLI